MDFSAFTDHLLTLVPLVRYCNTIVTNECVIKRHFLAFKIKITDYGPSMSRRHHLCQARNNILFTFLKILGRFPFALSVITVISYLFCCRRLIVPKKSEPSYRPQGISLFVQYAPQIDKEVALSGTHYCVYTS